MARQGSDVMITYQHQQVQAAETLRQIEACGVRAAMLPLDLDAIGSLETFAAAVRAQLQRWDASHFHQLANNAGLHAPSA
ncbi:MAG TPA: short-chain dehydrogenase, partial [Stenotrophomonas sp.]|nr:short-chain dehydrogenase [Stenotrophomonas sp.]